MIPYSKESSDNITERLFLGKMLQLFHKPERLSTKDYAEKYRWLGADVTASPGRMDCTKTPFMLYPMECMDNVDIKVLIGKKSAQIAWSETTNSYMSKRMQLDPQNIIVAFPRMESAKKYSREKIKPMIRSNPYLLEAIGNPDRCSYKFFKFPGGWLSLITARSTEDLKSTSVPIILVEEPDGLQDDVGNQGDALDILMQRQKTYEERKLIFAGTPTDAGFSRVENAYQQSNQMIYLVPCRSCGTLQQFDFNNLKCDPYQGMRVHEIYGKWNPATAYYECEHCKAIWDDGDRKWAVLEALNYNNLGWKALKPEETDIYGFAFCELMSSFAASTHIEIMKKKIKAELALSRGEEGLMKSFTNNTMGLAYETKNTGIDIAELKKRRLSYQEDIVPMGGIVLTAGIDVQHNRFAVRIRAWGKNNCSWGVSWKEIFGNVLDPEDPVWEELTEWMLGDIPHIAKNRKGEAIKLKIEALSIDCSDGKTSELVYNWVNAMQEIEPSLHIFAAKGSTDTNFNAEIFTEPGTPDDPSGKQLRSTMASRMGVNVFIMGAHKAHEEILRRLTLQGIKDRYYHCDHAYGQYEEQMLSCVKRISTDNKVTRYELKPGKRKEAMDCEKLALHAAYAIQLRNWTDEHWIQAERSIMNFNKTL
ncbi:MAG: phage terminase large subunit family protein [Candidatus Pacebacteria bacterium]|nr:phage terminase large subunit family protein [Candidatus Paceibacterota bacterium]